MIGSIVLTLAFITSLFTAVAYFLSGRGYKNTLNPARIAYHATTMLVILASSLLLYFILTHQYQYKYVYEYSSDNLSTGYLISTFWAGQEGSFLLWLLMTVIIGVFLQSFTSKRENLESNVMAVFSLATTFLLAMVSPLLKNPFAHIWMEPTFIDLKNLNEALLRTGAIQAFFFSDPNTNQSFFKLSGESYAALQSAGIPINEFIIHGKGLNPLLQNFWMQIHPPILFIGFALTTVPYSFAVAALISGNTKTWVKLSFPWMLALAGVLGLGIMLGGYWAYGVLGWGGYWAWDPVENSSLVPWLISVAAVHTFIVQRKSQAKDGGSGRFNVTNLILSILTFVLVLYSTFLTRSGILGDSSVHSFVDPGTLVYSFLLVFIASFILLGFGFLSYRWKMLNEEVSKDESLLSRELALFTGSVSLMASAIIVLLGTSAPIVKQSVEVSFYNIMHVPLAIIIGLLNGLSLLLRWKQTPNTDLVKKVRNGVISAIILTLITAIWGGMDEIMMILLLFSTYFTLTVNGEFAYKIIKGNFKMSGAYIAHIGLAVFILGVIGSSAYSVETPLDLRKGQKTEALGYSFEFTGYHPIPESNKYAFNVEVRKGNEFVANIKPVMYISDFNNGLMREPDILVGTTRDLYISPQGYEEGGNEAGTGHTLELQQGSYNSYKEIKISYSDFIKPDMSVMQTGGDFTMGAKLSIERDGRKVPVEVVMKKEGGTILYPETAIAGTDIKLKLVSVNPGTKVATISILDAKQGTTNAEVFSITASIKPFVNLVWIGVILLVAGFAVAAARRSKESAA